MLGKSGKLAVYIFNIVTVPLPESSRGCSYVFVCNLWFINEMLLYECRIVFHLYVFPKIGFDILDIVPIHGLKMNYNGVLCQSTQKFIYSKPFDIIGRAQLAWVD